MEHEAVEDDVQATDKLDAKAFAAEPRIRISYDEVQRIQRLSYRGVLSNVKKAQLLDAASSPQLLSKLLDAVQVKARKFLAKQLETVLELLTGTIEYEAILENVQLADRLDAKALAGESAIRVSYDERQKIQRLVYRGQLLDTKKVALKNAIASSTVLANLLDVVQKPARADTEALVEASLAMSMDTMEFAAAEQNVAPDQKLDPKAFDREPAFRVSYDEAAKVQHLVVRGLISRKKMDQLKNHNPPQVLVNLLNAVQNQAKAFIQELRVDRLLASDFDPLFTRLDGLIDISGDRRQELLKASIPYLHRTLTRQLVVETLATGLSSDPALTEALLTALLIDPNEPGKSLLSAFTSAGERGVSAIFFNATGDTLKTITMASVDTALQDDNKQPLKPDDAQSVRFEGYLEVPAAGAYRFFVVFSKKDAEAELRFEHVPDPVLKRTAVNDGAEISQFVELKAGIPYRFTFDARTLGSGDIQLLVQGENLPKGSLAQLTLYPEAAIDRVHRAYVLLAKTLQLIQGFGLGEREVRHMLTHAPDFDNLDLSTLPTSQVDDSSDLPRRLFGQFIRLADYARLGATSLEEQPISSVSLRVPGIPSSTRPIRTSLIPIPMYRLGNAYPSLLAAMP